MAKPICVINYDNYSLRGVSIEKMTDTFGEKLPDYHVICIPTLRYDLKSPPMDFKVFYEKDFTDIQYEEIKSHIINHLNKLTHNELHG